MCDPLPIDCTRAAKHSLCFSLISGCCPHVLTRGDHNNCQMKYSRGFRTRGYSQETTRLYSSARGYWISVVSSPARPLLICLPFSLHGKSGAVCGKSHCYDPVKDVQIRLTHVTALVANWIIIFFGMSTFNI